MKHVVVESTTDSVVGVLYHITPKGPRFSSLHDLIEKAQQEPVIKNHLFEIVLGKCPPKVSERERERVGERVSERVRGREGE